VANDITGGELIRGYCDKNADLYFIATWLGWLKAGETKL